MAGSLHHLLHFRVSRIFPASLPLCPVSSFGFQLSSRKPAHGLPLTEGSVSKRLRSGQPVPKGEERTAKGVFPPSKSFGQTNLPVSPMDRRFWRDFFSKPMKTQRGGGWGVPTGGGHQSVIKPRTSEPETPPKGMSLSALSRPMARRAPWTSSCPARPARRRGRCRSGCACTRTGRRWREAPRDRVPPG